MHTLCTTHAQPGVRPWDWTECWGTFVQGRGFRSTKTHDEEPPLQHRLQAPGRGGVPRRRGAFRLGRRHDLCRNLVRIWVRKYEAGEYDDDARAADTLQEFEAKVAALEQLVGRQALEIEFLERAVKSARLPNGAPTSAITGPPASPTRGSVR